MKKHFYNCLVGALLKQVIFKIIYTSYVENQTISHFTFYHVYATFVNNVMIGVDPIMQVYLA